MILKLSEFNLIIISIISLFLLYIVIVLLFTIIIHHKYFEKRITENKIIKNQKEEDYKDLKKESFSFISRNVKLNGNIYYYDTKDNKDVIIFSNGFNTVITNYLSEISYLSKLGYNVYSYDYEGVGNSEGAKFKGMPQAINNLEDCIKYVKSNNNHKKIILVGHSMGAYASCNVLNYVTVNKVIAIAPFNNIVDVVNDNIIKKLGRKIFLFPIIYRLYLNIKFKSYASYSTFNTLKNTNTKVLVLQGENDKTVSPNNFIKSMMTNTNGFINYLLLENKHHFPLMDYDAMNYDLFLKHQVQELKLKYKNQIPDEEIKILNENINYKLKNKLDEGILNEIKKFLSEV